jgi:uncharacterized SAM-binding protein YcdF (DUF218 family)
MIKFYLKTGLRLSGRFLRRTVYFLGFFFVLLIVLSFTDIPFNAYYWLGTHNADLKSNPDYIVVMGAGGMPGPEGLMRCFYAAEAAKKFPGSKIIIALPTLRKYFSTSHTLKMYHEIAGRGIDTTRFVFETEGTNTHEQSLKIAGMFQQRDTLSIMIITSPEHMYRSVAAFRKAGFMDVGGIPSFEDAFDSDLLLKEDEKSRNILEPGRNLAFRYNMWNYLKMEISVIREFFALGFYKLKGWI